VREREREMERERERERQRDQTEIAEQSFLISRTNGNKNRRREEGRFFLLPAAGKEWMYFPFFLHPSIHPSIHPV
jgi:hypothetical protein